MSGDAINWVKSSGSAVFERIEDYTACVQKGADVLFQIRARLMNYA
jgi:hypothetical protein